MVDFYATLPRHVDDKLVTRQCQSPSLDAVRFSLHQTAIFGGAPRSIQFSHDRASLLPRHGNRYQPSASGPTHGAQTAECREVVQRRCAVLQLQKLYELDLRSSSSEAALQLRASE